MELVNDEERIYEFVTKRMGVPQQIAEKMLDKYRKLKEYGDVFAPDAKRVPFDTYINNLESVLKQVLAELRKMRSVEERRRWILENVKLSTPRKVSGREGEEKIYSWAIPAFLTCPGYDEFCIAMCYALKNRYAVDKRIIRSRVINFLASLLPEFPEVMVRKIEEVVRKTGVPIFRLHDSGNFYTISFVKHMLEKLDIDPRELKELLGVDLDKLPEDWYVLQWRKIVERLPNVQFYTYTRTWRLLPIFKSIEKHLLPLKNFVLYLSVDKPVAKIENELRDALELAKRYRNVKIAWTGVIPPPGTVYAICPYELGRILNNPNIQKTCTQCKICAYGKIDVFFPVH